MVAVWLGPFAPTVHIGLVVATGSPLTRSFAGSKPLVSPCSSSYPLTLLTDPYPRRQGSGQPRMGARLDATDWLRCSVSSLIEGDLSRVHGKKNSKVICIAMCEAFVFRHFVALQYVT